MYIEHLEKVSNKGLLNFFISNFREFGNIDTFKIVYEKLEYKLVLIDDRSNIMILRSKIKKNDFNYYVDVILYILGYKKTIDFDNENIELSSVKSSNKIWLIFDTQDREYYHLYIIDFIKPHDKYIFINDLSKLFKGRLSSKFDVNRKFNKLYNHNYYYIVNNYYKQNDIKKCIDKLVNDTEDIQVYSSLYAKEEFVLSKTIEKIQEYFEDDLKKELERQILEEYQSDEEDESNLYYKNQYWDESELGINDENVF